MRAASGAGTSRGQPKSMLVSYMTLVGSKTLARAEKVHTRGVFGAEGTLPARVDKESFLGRGTNGRQLGLALARFRYLLRVRRERVLGRLGILAAVALAGVRTALGFVEVRVAPGAVDVAKRARS